MSDNPFERRGRFPHIEPAPVPSGPGVDIDAVHRSFKSVEGGQPKQRRETEHSTKILNGPWAPNAATLADDVAWAIETALPEAKRLGLVVRALPGGGVLIEQTLKGS
jgi:hypothetical protein